jgi:hypothetical protein
VNFVAELPGLLADTDKFEQTNLKGRKKWLTLETVFAEPSKSRSRDRRRPWATVIAARAAPGPVGL